MQNRIPFRMRTQMSFQFLAKFRIFQPRREAIHEPASPASRHRQPRLSLRVRRLMIGPGLNHLVGKTRESRWQSVSERSRHSTQKRRIGTRTGGDAFTRLSRKKLPRLRADRLPRIPVRAYLADSCAARFDEDVTSAIIGMNDHSAAAYHGYRKQVAFITIGADTGIRLRLQPPAQQHELARDLATLSALMTRAPSEKIKPTRRTQGHDGPARKFQLHESLVGSLEDIALPETHSFCTGQNAGAAQQSYRAFQKGSGADARHCRWHGPQQQHRRYA